MKSTNETNNALTVLESKVLTALKRSADGNGNDFGFVEDARSACGKAQLGGVIASLVKKGVIIVHADDVVNGLTQFTWPETNDGERIIP